MVHQSDKPSCDLPPRLLSFSLSTDPARSLAIGGIVACGFVGYGWYTYATESVKGSSRSGFQIKKQPDAKSKSSAPHKEGVQ